MTMKKIMIMAGGTGGHVFPALALAEELRSRGHSVVWLGTAQKLEAKVVPQAGFPIHFLSIQGLRGKGLGRWLRLPWTLFRAIRDARQILKQEQPDLVVGFGGFVSAPGGVAASWLKIPFIIHEQNAAAGLTNRLLCHLAKTIYAGFEGAFKSQKTVQVIGNPLRAALIEAAHTQVGETHDRLRVLILGGSLGARALNEGLPRQFSGLDAHQIEIWHQCGEGAVEATEARYAELGLSAKVTPFIQDMASAYTWADLVICRAGALTLSEILLFGKPSVLIPLPTAADDHQRKNAQRLVQKGAAIQIEQTELVSNVLGGRLQNWIQDRTALNAFSEQALSLARPKATLELANACDQHLSSQKR